MIARRAIGLVFTLVLLITFSSSAQELYIANESQSKLQLLNFNTTPPQLTTLYNIGAKPDDLILNSLGQLIYSVPALGVVNLYDPFAGTNTTLVSGMSRARDLQITPDGQSLLIALYPLGQIVRFNFATGTTTVLAKKLGNVNGIAYDPYGNLYAVAKYNTIVQLDPVTGAVLNTLVLEPHHGINGADGLVYDSYTGSLWGAHAGTTGIGVVQIPVTAAGLGSSSSLYVFNTTGAAPDGIKSDGKGNLYIGAIFTVLVYNIPTNTITHRVVTKGADGVSLVPGTY